MKISRTLLFAALALLGLVTTASAQTTASRPVLYRLAPSSSYEEGCQEPCLCPISWSDDLFGTLLVTFDHSSPNWFDYYRVEQVNWVLDFGGVARRITGNGEYRVGGPVALTQQLTLDLATDGGAPVHFDSGLVPGGGPVPSIAIAIAMNNFFCYDRVFSLDATPVTAAEIRPYSMKGSDYVVGCQPPCLCPIALFHATGRFGLVDLGPASDPTHQHYALVNVGWQTVPGPTPPDRMFRGFGIYALDASTLQHRLTCDFTDGNGVTARFDSGLVTGGSAFPPRIDIDMAVNGFYCYDQVLQFRARPR